MVSKTNTTMQLIVFFLVTIIVTTQLSTVEFKNSILSIIVIALLAAIYIQNRQQPVYLLNFSCYKPRNACKCTKQTFLNVASSVGTFTGESMEFQRKVLEKSGIGEESYIPEMLLRLPPRPCMRDARKDIEELMFGVVDGLLSKTNVDPRDIGILIVNCSLFSPTPSLSAMIVNHYKLRSDILSYTLKGMGCSAGIIAIDLAQKLLQVHNDSYCLVASIECGTLSTYFGNDRSMLLSNCLFRMGGSAVLLSNKRSDKGVSKYQLLHTVRSHKGSDDKSFNSVVQREDSEGKIGISLSKELMVAAGDALRANITAIGPLVLPLSEKLFFVGTWVMKKLFKTKNLKPYVPDFKLAFEHFCVHVGGKAVLDVVQKNLVLTEWLMEPSRMTLYRFGNTSSTSIWYELAYSEAKGRVKKGDRVWQIAFGSGFKCYSAVWRALGNVNPTQETNPWMDEIHLFPVDVPK